MTPLGEKSRDLRCSTCSFVAVAKALDLGGSVEPKRRRRGLAVLVWNDVGRETTSGDDDARRGWTGAARAARLARAMVERRIADMRWYICLWIRT